MIFFLQVNDKNAFNIDGKLVKEIHNISINNYFFKSNMLRINDTFSIRGSLVSTIPPNLSIHDDNSSNITSDNITNSLFNNNSSNQTNMPKNISSNISDDLVSLLSGIIIQSIHNGNPTLSNTSSDSISNSKETNPNLISGSWKLDVNNGNITDFVSNFEIISSNGTGIHWFELNNFKTNDKLYFGNDNSVFLNGKLDFLSDNNHTNETTNVLLTINNLQLIELIFLDKDISSKFNNYPLYGTIDAISIKN